MRKVNEIKYPNSARLFNFCKSVLDIKFGNSRVIDQDVGQILGFDPADCSHWKKGRKNVKSIDSIKAIAAHLGVDERFVIDVAMGELTDQEALSEYRGLGGMEISSEFIETIRKDWQRKKSHTWNSELETELKKFFTVDYAAVDRVVDQILAKINFVEAPLFLPEIPHVFTGMKIVEHSPMSAEVSSGFSGAPIAKSVMGGSFEIHCEAGSLKRPIIRFQIAREMAKYFVDHVVDVQSVFYKENEKYIREIYGNVFASRLLVPAKAVREEMKKLDLRKDVVTQLSEIFWVSRTLMNRRLRDILSSTEGV